MNTPTADSLQLTLDAPARIPAGGAAVLTLRARNAGSTSLTLYLRGRSIAFDFVVRDGGGRIVWRRLEGQMVPAIVQAVTLDAGRQLELHETWHPASDLPPGPYTIVGELLRDEPEPLRTPAARVDVFR